MRDARVRIRALRLDTVTSDVCHKEVAFAASLNKRFAPIIFRAPTATAYATGTLVGALVVVFTIPRGPVREQLRKRR